MGPEGGLVGILLLDSVHGSLTPGLARPTRELADHQRSEIKQLADCVCTLSQEG